MPLLSASGRCASSALSALALVTFLTACGSTEGSSDPGTAAQAEVTIPFSAARVEVLDAGREPREVLRMDAATGTGQSTTLTTSSQVTQQIDQQPAQDFSSPETTIPLEAEVSSAVSSESPNTVIDMTLSGMSTPDTTMQAALDGADGSRAGLSVTAAGAVTALRLRPSTAAPNPARAAIEQAFGQAVYRTVALPDSAVGIGARWVIRQDVTSEIALDQITTVTLTAKENTRLTLTVEVNQTPKNPVWELAGDAGTLNIDQYVMTGTGTVTIDTGLPLPVAGAMTVGGDQSYSDPGGQSVIRQTIANSIRWSE
ncbi:hypothetical protein [Rhodococcus sp. 27YEA15]|uniref:hypothetical protein n=1 Tax=Rhodococcus sp. 27YEA15 TaxID=3156259 RepID=UPI003C798992